MLPRRCCTLIYSVFYVLVIGYGLNKSKYVGDTLIFAEYGNAHGHKNRATDIKTLSTKEIST